MTEQRILSAGHTDPEETCPHPSCVALRQPAPAPAAPVLDHVRLALDVADAERAVVRANEQWDEARKAVDEADEAVGRRLSAVTEDLRSWWTAPNKRGTAQERAEDYAHALVVLQETTERWIDAAAVRTAAWTELQRLHKLLTPGFDRRNARQAGYL